MIARDVPRVARVLSRVAGTHQRIPYNIWVNKSCIYIHRLTYKNSAKK